MMNIQNNDTLEQRLEAELRKLTTNSAPCYVSKVTIKYFKDKKRFNLLPRNSLGPNPIENMWVIVKARFRKIQM